MSVPRSLLVKTVYAERNGSHILTHHTQWLDENSASPTVLQQWKSRQRGTSVILNQGIKTCCYIKGINSLLVFSGEFGPQTRGWGMEVRLENETQSKRGNIQIDWDLTGAQEQVKSVGRCLLFSGIIWGAFRKSIIATVISNLHS